MGGFLKMITICFSFLTSLFPWHCVDWLLKNITRSSTIIRGNIINRRRRRIITVFGGKGLGGAKSFLSWLLGSSDNLGREGRIVGENMPKSTDNPIRRDTLLPWNDEHNSSVTDMTGTRANKLRTRRESVLDRWVVLSTFHQAYIKENAVLEVGTK
jgi:hypothetical protein